MVFENLLAAITPESRENARKKTGSYYTPRPVVEYMVDEALTAHLAGILGKKSEPKLRKLLGWKDIADNEFSAEEEKNITDAIDKLRILDPAVGSGAFPMGMLHKLVHILWQVDKKNEKWKQKQLEKAAEISDPSIRSRTMDDIERVFSAENNYDDYGRKLFLIQNAIHGADLQPVAVQIARLRFFISLIIDQKPRDDQPNYGIEPLPNLETKFVAADSLIGLTRKGQGNLSETEEVEKLKERINRVRIDHFGANTRKEKMRLRAKDKELRDELAKALTQLGFAQNDANRFAAWDLYDQTAGADWFDAELMMGVRNGFDIVIGNPPYVQIQKFSGKPDQQRWQEQQFATFDKGGDLYCLFYERGLQMLKRKGVMTLITSNSFMRSSFGEKLRGLLSKESAMQTVVDFGSARAFNATTRPVIVVTRNATLTTGAKLTIATVKNPEDILQLSEFVEKNGKSLTASYFSAKEWVLAGEATHQLLEKMIRVGEPMGAVGGRIYYGIKTGFNEALVIDSEMRKQLIAKDAKSEEVICPWFRPRGIQKWRSSESGLHVIAIASSTNREWPWSGIDTEVQAEKIFAQKYSAIFQHLSKYRKQLSKRTDKGMFWWELRSCDYYAAFAEPKIIYPDIADAMRASYDTTGVFISAPAYILPTNNLSLMGVLHSKAFDWLLATHSALWITRGKGDF